MREAGALVVYDFDDHLLLEGVESHGVKEEVVAFMNAADVVTVGSEYLGVDARNFHHNVFVLENPVDIESATLVRERKAELKRVGWFGTPAGLVDLRAIKTAEPIETITRGGDIEFDLKSIDRTLTAFDLLLLPVEHNRWNLAKNANRMVKAVALGVPVLATATPAHIATVEALGLDDRFLVREGESWDDKIAGLRQDFSAVQDAILRARGRAIELFAMQRIGGDWLQHIERALDAKGPQRRGCANRPARRSRTLRSSRSLTAAPTQPACGGRQFRSAAVTSWRQRRPAIISSCSTRCGRRLHRSSRTGYCSSRKAFAPRRASPASRAERCSASRIAMSSWCEARSVAFPPTSGLPTPKICAERSASHAIPAWCWRAGRGSCSSLGGRRNA